MYVRSINVHYRQSLVIRTIKRLPSHDKYNYQTKKEAVFTFMKIKRGEKMTLPDIQSLREGGGAKLAQGMLNQWTF